MTLSDFRTSLADTAPPVGVSRELHALWHDARGEWARAHETVQDLETPAAAWVHAYLHRKEGDLSNARYWYHRAGQPVFTGALDAEWGHIAGALLA
jgi:hypothetical protein